MRTPNSVSQVDGWMVAAMRACACCVHGGVCIMCMVCASCAWCVHHVHGVCIICMCMVEWEIPFFHFIHQATTTFLSSSCPLSLPFPSPSSPLSFPFPSHVAPLSLPIFSPSPPLSSPPPPHSFPSISQHMHLNQLRPVQALPFLGA
ncbi:unnamed protein product [Closterium sp. Naga37s-1]|nr:unnamed protein product [Closterium sp. Naga37s-1]